MTTDLIAFITTRLDEDERTARAVTGSGSWSAYLEGGDDGWAIETVPGGDPAAIIGDKAMTDHIARHDPARVLRELEAKRRVLRLYTNALSALEHRSGFASQRNVIQDETCVEILGEALRAIATAWVTHPDHRQEWLP